jgi:hypothetical protein
LFIATWSLSECPLKLREDVFNVIEGFKYYLIAYQRIFDKINNEEYFEEKMKKMENYSWFHFPQPFRSQSKYLMGENYYV